jgi:death on curing protein
LADALSAHDRALSFGGLAGIPNPSLVQSAIGRPYSGHYRCISRKCAALVESVSRNHGFADGNKRTAIILLHTLLKESGYKLCPISKDENIETAIEQTVLDVVTGAITFDRLETWLQVRICRR